MQKTKFIYQNNIKHNNFLYRADVDGLRAIAVFSVIFYHADFIFFGKHWFRGGYIGVDIFFVISGYLITSILLAELITKSSINFFNFYERRARRILPMLLVVITSSSLIAYNELSPTSLIEYTKSVLTSIFFISNFYFYFNSTTYWDDNSLLMPLLHTWTLSIEEQFYLFYPVFIYFLFNRSKYFLSTLITLTFLSFIFSNFLVEINNQLNFFLPFSRLWEFITGSIVAYSNLKYKGSHLHFCNNILTWFGCILILYCIFAFDPSITYQSYYTVIPVIGSALVIAFPSKEKLLSKILKSKLLVWFGLISYSAYLWHFPVFAFSRVKNVEPNNYVKFLMILLVFILASMSYVLIERPSRNKEILPKKVFLSIIITFIFLISMFSAYSISEGGFPKRYTEGWLNFEIDDGKLRKGFWDDFDQNIENLSKPSANKINVYIFGNSHSADLLSAIYYNYTPYDEFHFLKVIQQEQLSCFDERDNRFLSQRNSLYNSDAYKKSEIFIIATRFVNAKCDKLLKDNPSDADGLNFLIPRLKKDGKKILILGNTLVLDKIDGQWLEEFIYNKAIKDKINFNSFEVFNSYKILAEELAFHIQSEYNIKTNERLERYTTENHIYYFDRRKLFCNSITHRCLTFTDNAFRIRFDYGHLTREGKKEFSTLLIRYKFNLFLNGILKSRQITNVAYVPYLGTIDDSLP